MRFLVGKTIGELDGNKQRTLRMAIRESWLEVDDWSGVILKRGDW
jgi:hypothetical protein